MKPRYTHPPLFAWLLPLLFTFSANAQTYYVKGGGTQAASNGGTFTWSGPTHTAVTVQFISDLNNTNTELGYYCANLQDTWDISGTNYNDFLVQRNATIRRNTGMLSNTTGNAPADYPFWVVYTFATPVPASEIFMMLHDVDQLGTAGSATGHIWINKDRNGNATSTGTASNSDFQRMTWNQPGKTSAFINNSTGQINWGLGFSGASNKYIALAGITNNTIKSIVVETQNISGNVNFGLSSLQPLTMTTLPITLRQFNAVKAAATQVRTAWDVSETGNDVSHYELERSNSVSDNFTTVASIAATGLSRYQQLDNLSGQTGVVYYRLKMIETGGRFKYSAVVPVSLNSKAEVLKALPNPATERLTVLLESVVAGKAVIQLISPAGQPVLAQQETVVRGPNIFDLENLGRFAKGTYFLKITSGSGQIAETKTIILN